MVMLEHVATFHNGNPENYMYCSIAQNVFHHGTVILRAQLEILL